MQNYPYEIFEIDINKFVKGDKINGGGFGVVYSAKEKETEKIYAAKVINCSDDEEKCKEMINREIKIMICSNHPTIIKFIGYSLVDFHSANNVTIIMELAKNGSLSKILSSIQNCNGPKDYTNTTRQIILIGVARGMKYLHDRNIIHRDLKPGNVLLDEDFHPHITDFGMSKFFEDEHSKSQTIHGGTLQYMAPEIIEGERYDIKVDVYSFAILMYEVVTDCVPYPELEAGKVNDFRFRKAIVDKNLRPKFTVPVKKPIQELIEKCWSKNPDFRPSFKEIFEDLTNLDDIENNCLLEDADIEEVKLYIEDISEVSDPIEKLIQKIEKIKTDHDKLVEDNKKLTCENEKLSKSSAKLKKSEKKLKKMEDENESLKKELEKQNEENKQLINSIQNLKIVLKTKNIYVTINEFNLLPLKTQQLLTSEVISTLPNSKTNKFLKNINKLMTFLLKHVQSEGQRCLEISTENNEQPYPDLKSGYRLQFLSSLTEILLNNESFKKSSFIDILKLFEGLSFEIKYPSVSFKNIYDQISVVKDSKSGLNDVEMNVCISGIRETDQKFYKDKNIDNVVLDTTIINIKSDAGNGSFEECSSLKQIQIKSSLLSIERNAFLNCVSLKEVTIPSSVTSIEYNAFCGCSSLKRIEFCPSSSLTEIKERSFIDCSSLESIEIPSSVTKIGKFAFQRCISLKTVDIPSSVVEIGSYAFDGCSSLLFVAVPSSEISIKEAVFNGCSSLTEVVIPSSIKSIGKNAFCGCSSLNQISIPSSVSEICEGAFTGCSSLIQISIPDSVTKIGDFAFIGCSALKKIVISSSTSSFGEFIFDGCSSLSQMSIPPSVDPKDIDLGEDVQLEKYGDYYLIKRS